MFELRNISISINTRYLIRSLSLTLNKKDKLAIIGEEGNGKSTLLKAISGTNSYFTIEGTIDLKSNTIGFLPQSINEEYLNQKVFDYLFVDDNDYYNKVNNLYKKLSILKIDDNLLEQNLNTLSGGEKVKIGILKLLLENYDILLLDEPTNDLDIETLEWLEEFIKMTDKQIIYVSHDETLLSKTANMILHIEQVKHKMECRHTIVRSDYDTYIKNRLQSLEHQTKVALNEKREFQKKEDKLKQIRDKVNYELNTISRSNPHGAKLLKKKMHSIKTQEKKLENTTLTEIPDVEENINLFFEDVFVPRNKIIINLDIPKLEVGKKVLANNIKLDIVGNAHIAIIGKNGMGKTTLIKKIYEELKERSDLKIGYMPQNYEDILDSYDNVLSFLTSINITSTMARNYLGNMNFTRDEMTGNLKNLSNGTKAKLFLIKLVLDKCNCLILDEPTRNLSPLSNPIIRKVLKEFKGTIISVSHDRKYLLEVIDTIYVLTFDGLVKKC